MITEKIDNAFSRVMNGNFAAGLAYWDGDGDLVHQRHGQNIQALAGDHYFNRPSPSPSTEAPPVDQVIPMYAMEANGNFWHDVQYNDLALFPSIRAFEGVSVVPCGYDEVLLTAVSTDSNPFALQSGSDLIAVELGDMIVIDDEDGVRSGEYRAGKVLSTHQMKAAKSETPLAPEFTNEDFQGALYQISATLVQVRILGNVLTSERASGGVGLKTGDHFVSGNPLGSGRILGWTWDGTYTLLTLTVDQGLTQFPPAATWTAVTEWFIAPRFMAIVTRRLPVCIYDLTLAYSLRDGYTLNPVNTKIQFIDEVGTVLQTIDPEPNWIEEWLPFVPHAAHLKKWKRIIQNYRWEAAEPYFGQARILFNAGAATSQISDVVLYKGDYTSKVTDLEEFGFLEGRISVESEVIPKGTVIAYVGGSACPPGFDRIEGIGKAVSPLLDAGSALLIDLGTADTWIDSVDKVRAVDGTVRTSIRLDSSVDRSTGAGQLDFQRSGGWVNIEPWEPPPNMYSDYWRAEFYQFRAKIGNPSPFFVPDQGFVECDIVPGCILELRFPPPKGSVFAIISQYSQGNIVTRAYEQQPIQPLPPFWWNAFWWWNELYLLWDSDEYFYDRGIYGNIVQVREESRVLELIGDYSDVVAQAVGGSIPAYVWKSGVVGHAEKLGDMRSSPLYTIDGFGGYGLLIQPHSHSTGKATAELIKDILSGAGTLSNRHIPVEHTHLHLYGAVPFPKVRPVLLCQKI